MTKNILLKTFMAFLLMSATTFAQNEQDVDAIEKARQAKEAAEKAAAEASAATEAAIEAAANKAARDARQDAKRKKEEEEARKLAEAQAAEEAELDAAASAAAEAAKRKMAEELGIEYEGLNVSEEEEEEIITDSLETDAFVAKEKLGISIGGAASVGVLSGASFTSVPLGGTIVITTPVGFKLGPFDYTVSLAFGGYQGTYDSNEDSEFTGPTPILDEFNPILAAVGGNLTLANLVFAEGHVGLIGKGSGFRGFAGLSLEKLMNKTLDLPINIKVGSEAFISSDMGSGNPSGWISLGLRLDYSL